MLHLRKFAVLCLLILIGAIQTSTVFACSPSSLPTMQEIFDETPIIVKARVIQSNSSMSTVNGHIIQVETYYKGQGAEYLLIVPYARGTSNSVAAFRDDIGTCLTRFASLPADEPLYFLLQPHFPGSFTYTYSPIRLVETQTTNDIRVAQVLEGEFEQLVSGYNHGETYPPEPNYPYPISSLLHITTQTSQHNVLPVDGSAPREITYEEYLNFHGFAWRYGENRGLIQGCAAHWNCAEFSPNLIDIAAQIEENRIMLTHQVVDGQSFLFSPVNIAIAIWNENNIDIRAMPYTQVYGLLWGDETHKVINSISLDLSPVSNADNAAWSPDGRILAFSDTRGLWLWDVFSGDVSPRLLVPSHNDIIPVPVRFSPMGSYLLVQGGEIREYIYLITESRIPDGIFSPDEQTFLAFDTTLPITDFEVCFLPLMACNPGTMQIRDVFWLNSGGGYFNACYENECMVFYQSTYIMRYAGFTMNILPFPEDVEEIVQVIYQHETGLMAIQRDDYTLEINRDGWGSRDLSEWLDSPIVEIEWLPSFFRYE